VGTIGPEKSNKSRARRLEREIMKEDEALKQAITNVPL
jgi:hypothetical protein